ncbi:MAG: TRIC cation channel family protein [Acidimicrobiales bacterium]
MPADVAVDIPFWLEAIAIVAGALAGRFAGEREARNFGIVALAALGLGGGLIRHTLLQQGTPVGITDSRFLPLALGASVPALFLTGVVSRLHWVSQPTVATGLGVLGADKALLAGVAAVGAVVIGVLAGTGGSILADLIVGVPPVLFRPGVLLGVASALGTTVYVVGAQAYDARAAWFVFGVVLITLTRITSAATGWGVGPAGQLAMKTERELGR